MRRLTSFDKLGIAIMAFGSTGLLVIFLSRPRQLTHFSQETVSVSRPALDSEHSLRPIVVQAVPHSDTSINELLRQLRNACILEDERLIKDLEKQVSGYGSSVFTLAFSQVVEDAERLYTTEKLYFMILNRILLAVVLPLHEETILQGLISIGARQDTTSSIGTQNTQPGEIMVMSLVSRLLTRLGNDALLVRLLELYWKSRRLVVKRCILQAISGMQSLRPARDFLLQLLQTEQDAEAIGIVAAALAKLGDPSVAPEIYSRFQELFRNGTSRTYTAITRSLINQLGISGSLPLLVDLLERQPDRSHETLIGQAIGIAIKRGELSSDDVQFLIASLETETRGRPLAMLLQALSEAPVRDKRVARKSHETISEGIHPVAIDAAVAALLAHEEDEARLQASISGAMNSRYEYVRKSTGFRLGAFSATHPEAEYVMSLMRSAILNAQPEERASLVFSMGVPWLGDQTPDVYSQFLMELQSSEQDPKVQDAIRHALSGEKNMANYFSAMPDYLISPQSIAPKR